MVGTSRPAGGGPREPPTSRATGAIGSQRRLVIGQLSRIEQISELHPVARIEWLSRLRESTWASIRSGWRREARRADDPTGPERRSKACGPGSCDSHRALRTRADPCKSLASLGDRRSGARFRDAPSQRSATRRTSRPIVSQQPSAPAIAVDVAMATLRFVRSSAPMSSVRVRDSEQIGAFETRTNGTCRFRHDKHMSLTACIA